MIARAMRSRPSTVLQGTAVEIEDTTTWTRRVAVCVTSGDHLEPVFQGDDKKFGAERDMCPVPRADEEILLARDCAVRRG
jgi:hypothetical protein